MLGGASVISRGGRVKRPGAVGGIPAPPPGRLPATGTRRREPPRRTADAENGRREPPGRLPAGRTRPREPPRRSADAASDRRGLRGRFRQRKPGAASLRGGLRTSRAAAAGLRGGFRQGTRSRGSWRAPGQRTVLLAGRLRLASGYGSSTTADSGWITRLNVSGQLAPGGRASIDRGCSRKRLQRASSTIELSADRRALRWCH